MRDNKGITMIILVVTVIVLIILAGVGINLLIGNDGILEKEKQVINEYENEAENLASKQLTSFSSSSVAITKPTKPTKIEYGKIQFKDGTESTIGENESLKADYQKKVATSFFTSNETKVQSGEATWEWQLFYDDDEYIFLIASDYVPVSTLPIYGNPGFTEQAGNLYPRGAANPKYNASFCSNASNCNDYVLASYGSGKNSTVFKNNPLTNKYLKWLQYSTSYVDNDIRVLAFMFDNDKWGQYAKDYTHNYANSFAIGGPTIELFAKSWNSVNNSKIEQYDTMISGTNYTSSGYILNGGTEDNDFGSTTNMWCIRSGNKALACWIADPALSAQNCMRAIFRLGRIAFENMANDGNGFRPIVVIPKVSVKELQLPTYAGPYTPDGEENYKNPYIPDGFARTGGEWNNGFSIRNTTTYDEFVWVPCTLTATSDTVAFSRTLPTTSITDENYSSDPNYMYNTSKYTNFTDETGAKADAIRTSVGKYGGFYIAKYEASSSNGTETGKAKSVPNATPWYQIFRDDAIEIAEKMVNTSDGVKSALISGECWDTALKWMVSTGNTEYDINSDGKGWFYNNSGNSLKLTGASVNSANANRINNIWDMAGNLLEWTTENCKDSSNSANAIYRGSYYGSSTQTAKSAANRYGMYANSTNGVIGFRVVLYKQ